MPLSLQEGLALWSLQRAAKARRPGSQANRVMDPSGWIHLVIVIHETLDQTEWIHSGSTLDPNPSDSGSILIRFPADATVPKVIHQVRGSLDTFGHAMDVVLCCIWGTKITTPYFGSPYQLNLLLLSKHPTASSPTSSGS